MASVVNNVLKLVPKRIVHTQVRFYSRWDHRRPVKVYTPDEYAEMEKNVDNKPQESNHENSGGVIFEEPEAFKPKWKFSKTQDEEVKYKIKTKKVQKPLIATNQKSKVRSQTTTDMLETVIDGEGNFVYTKMKDNDHRVGSVLTEVKSKKDDKKDVILLEGKRLIKDALLSGCHLKYVIFSRKAEIEYLKPFLPKVGAQLYKMPYREMQMWSDLMTTPGIMGIFKTPDVENFDPKQPLPVTIICENIREPGNLGTILRVCAAIGCKSVILTKGCVNLWDTKVLRSSVGAHFKLKIHRNMEWDQIEEMVGSDANFFIADNKVITGEGDDLGEILEKVPLLPYYGVNFGNCMGLVLIVGGETLGVSKESYEFALKTSGARLNIPLSNEIDSLNVGAALGIIAFEIKKQLTCK